MIMHIIDAAKQGAAWTYPSIFAALLLSGYAVGRHVSDGRDAGRKWKKDLKESLYREMTENQAPAILAVGSELPWEEDPEKEKKDAEMKDAVAKLAEKMDALADRFSAIEARTGACAHVSPEVDFQA